MKITINSKIAVHSLTGKCMPIFITEEGWEKVFRNIDPNKEAKVIITIEQVDCDEKEIGLEKMVEKEWHGMLRSSVLFYTIVIILAIVGYLIWS